MFALIALVAAVATSAGIFCSSTPSSTTIQSNNYRAVHVQGSSNSGNYSVVFKKITNLKPKFSPSTAPTVYLPPSITQYFNPQVLSYTGINYFKPKPLVAKDPHNRLLDISGHQAQPPESFATERLAVVSTAAPTSKLQANPSVILSRQPTRVSSVVPTKRISQAPISSATSIAPSVRPSIPFNNAVKSTKPPTRNPTRTSAPSLRFKSVRPTRLPTSKSTSLKPTSESTEAPTEKPSYAPSSARKPTFRPTKSLTPSRIPTKVPVKLSSPSAKPRSSKPSKQPLTKAPSPKPVSPTEAPSMEPIASPTEMPTCKPTLAPRSKTPTRRPTRVPTVRGGGGVQGLPTGTPTGKPTRVPKSDDIQYHNGTVMVSKVVIYNIYVGAFSASTMDLVDYFASNIGTSAYWKTLYPYYQYINGVKISPPASGPTAKFGGRYVYMPTKTSGEISEADFIDAIFTNNKTKGLPISADGAYLIMFHGGLTLQGWNDDDPYGYCGYHTLYASPDGTSQVKVGIVGDPTTASPWNLGCLPWGDVTANKDFSGDNFLSVYAHELVEITTDGYGNAWYRDKDGLENADICNFNFVDQFDNNWNIPVGSKKFLIQANYWPGVGCVIKPPTFSPRPMSPTFMPVRSPTISPNMAFDLSYHNSGGVITPFPARLFNVYLGELSRTTTGLMNYFAKHIGYSSWFRILTTYYNQEQGTVNVQPNASFVANATFYSDQRGLTLNDTDIETLLVNMFNNPRGQVFNQNFDVYTIMFRGDFSVTMRGKKWLRDWCSYHSSFFAYPLGRVVKYAVVGDPSTAPGNSGSVCAPVSGRPTANGDLGADSMAVGYAQQLAQTITDFNGYGWYSDLNYLEVGSACEGNFGPNFDISSGNANIRVGDKRFLAQALWQRGVGCTMARQ